MAAMTPADVGKVVLARRVERGIMSREALAEATGLTSRTLSDIEVGRRYSYSRSTLTRLEQVLGMAIGSIQAMLDEAARERGNGKSDQPPPAAGPVSKWPAADVGAEMRTITGLLANLYAPKLDLAQAIEASDTTDEQRFLLVKRARLAQDAFDRRLLAEIAAEIERMGGEATDG